MSVLASALSISGCQCGGDPADEATFTDASEVKSTFEGIPQKGSELGDPRAPVTLTDFSDLQCPYCRNFAIQVLPVLVSRYVREGRLRIVFGNYPILGTDSERAGRVAEAMGLQNRMWQFIESFMQNQGPENTGYVTDAFLLRIASGVPGADAQRALRDAESSAVAQAMSESAKMARRFHIRGEPTFLLGLTGKEPRVLRASPSNPEAFIEAIDALQ